MKQVQEENQDHRFILQQCCIEAGEAHFYKRFPLEWGADDFLRDHLLTLVNKWGPITQAVTRGIFIRTVSSEIDAGDALPYFNAEMQTLRCSKGHIFNFALLSRRVYYLVWRIHIICLSYFQDAGRAEGVTSYSGTADWPGPEQVEQLRLAFRMYQDEKFLTNEGFGGLYKWTLDASMRLALQHNYISEMALLFILLHEIHHSMEAFHEMKHDMPPVVQTDLRIYGLGKKQRENWVSEMQADCNALFMLIVSVASVFHEKFSKLKEEALTDAHSLAAQGADLVLHCLEFVERQRYGILDAEKAKSMPAFLTHPPCDLRRKALSYTSYQIVTKKPISMLFKGYSTNEWRRIAQDCGSQISIRERLYSAAEV